MDPPLTSRVDHSSDESMKVHHLAVRLEGRWFGLPRSSVYPAGHQVKLPLAPTWVVAAGPKVRRIVHEQGVQEKQVRRDVRAAL